MSGGRREDSERAGRFCRFCTSLLWESMVDQIAVCQGQASCFSKLHIGIKWIFLVFINIKRVHLKYFRDITLRKISIQPFLLFPSLYFLSFTSLIFAKP